jgi:sulfatase maturation enzyme AslB (radical SAM superfamily)
MDLSLAEEIFAQASGQGAAVRFTGWGEPLIHPKIDLLAEKAKKHNLKLKIYTNGLALTEAMMDRFIEAGVDEVQFSLQGLTPEQYAFNRVGSDYDKLKKNIIMASERRQNNRPFLSVLTSVLADEAAKADGEDFTNQWLQYVDKVAIDLTNLNFVSSLSRVSPYLNNQSSDLRRGPCVDVFLALEIKYDGSIQFCGQDSKGLEEHTIGRFGQISLASAWLGAKMERQRQLVGRDFGHALSPVCQNCYHNTDKYELFKKLSRQAKTGDGEWGDERDRTSGGR